MNKTEFLSASLPYKIHLSRDGKKDGGRLRDIRVSNVIDLNGRRLPDRYTVRVGSKSIYYTNIENYIPIVRPLDDLTKECIQKDYNDGKPFVPIAELAKMVTNISGYKLVNREQGYVLQVKDREFLYHSGTNSFNFFIGSLKEIVPYQLQLFQQMIRWHFWPDMPDGEEVIYVTDEFNPYK